MLIYFVDWLWLKRLSALIGFGDNFGIALGGSRFPVSFHPRWGKIVRGAIEHQHPVTARTRPRAANSQSLLKCQRLAAAAATGPRIVPPNSKQGRVQGGDVQGHSTTSGQIGENMAVTSASATVFGSGEWLREDGLIWNPRKQ